MESTLPINSINNLLANSTTPNTSELDQCFRGKGKLLLTGEYLILKGAKGLALPTKLGQTLSVEYSQSFSPTLHWKSFDYQGKLWLEGKFEFWHFDILNEVKTPELIVLQKLLRQARKANFHFLRDEVDVHVETRVEFPLEWGLGSSSTLIYNIAQWAYISPFELLFEGIGKGSGYDIACAQSRGPIVYTKQDNPHWETVDFNPDFKDKLYFLYLGNKQNTSTEIEQFQANSNADESTLERISEITDEMVSCTDFLEFNKLVIEHENIISNILGKKKVKDSFFEDFWGEVKSLGAWGGDFCLVTSDKSFEETKNYFLTKGLNVLMPFDELAYCPRNNDNKKNNNDYLH